MPKRSSKKKNQPKQKIHHWQKRNLMQKGLLNSLQTSIRNPGLVADPKRKIRENRQKVSQRDSLHRKLSGPGRGGPKGRKYKSSPSLLIVMPSIQTEEAVRKRRSRNRPEGQLHLLMLENYSQHKNQKEQSRRLLRPNQQSKRQDPSQLTNGTSSPH